MHIIRKHPDVCDGGQLFNNPQFDCKNKAQHKHTVLGQGDDNKNIWVFYLCDKHQQDYLKLMDYD